jgi:hybrid cluster-associated redox disulfide protein
MTGTIVRPDVTVADVLQNSTEVARVFISRKTACVGCYMARFCSVRDVAATYELNLEQFRQEISQALIKAKGEAKND